NTAVLRISRDNYFIGNTTRCLEQKLMLRVIQINGSVIPINYDDIGEIQDINYCLVNDKSPINIYPLFDQYILITYIHASNTSDNTTFTDRGMVIDWNGTIVSKLEFGPSYLLPGTNIWIPNEYLTVNIDPRMGFLRLSTVYGTNNFNWAQYAYYGNGLFILLQYDAVENLDFTNFQVSILPTLNYGYAIIYTNTTNRNMADPLSKSGGLYVILLDYNQTTSKPFLLYENFSTQNLVFTRLTCSIDYISISYVCVLTIEQEGQTPVNGTSNTSTETNKSYIKISFLSTGQSPKSEPIFNLTLTSFKTLSLGGYALISQQTALNSTVNFTFYLYDEDNKLWEFLKQPIISNLASSYDILPNNTMLVAHNEITTAWNLLAINLPQLGPFNDSDYGNLHVNSTYPSKGSKDQLLNLNMISIIYQEPVSFSDGNLTIYQKINEIIVLRQIINSKTCQFNKSVVKINIFSSDKSIGQNRTDFAKGILRLTNKGTQYFLGLSDKDRDSFFDYLIKELTILIPIEDGRLFSNRNNQLDPADVTKILISISISGTRDSDKMTTSEIKTNLDQLIKNKIDTLKMLNSRIGGLELFSAPLSDKSLKIIFWGSWFSLFLTEIPQLIIQYELALLSTIVSSLAIFSNIVSKLIMKRTYSIDKIEFGPSYLLPDTNIWIPNDYLTVNIDPQKGFLHLSMVRGTNNFKWTQYEYKGNGLFTLLQNDTVENLDFTNFQVSILPTLNYGYAIIYTNTTNRNMTDPLSKSGGLYVILLNYNQTTTSQPFVLYEKSTQNIVFTRLACSIDYAIISYVCVLIIEQEDPASINGANNTSTTAITSCIKIRFLSTGSRLKLDSIFNLTLTSLKTLPPGGFALISQQTALNSTVNFTIHLYDEYSKPSTWEFPQQPIISNLASSYDILPNNTMLIAQNETTTTWNILSIVLPNLGPFNDSGYGNLHVNSTYPPTGFNSLSLNSDMIYIIYKEPVSFSDGNLTIYQIINQNNVLRQRIGSKTCQCTISGTVVKINISSYTFNVPNGQYYIQIDDNFVKTEYGEPMPGIQPKIWTFETVNRISDQNQKSIGDFSGIIRLTTEGTQYFQELSDLDKDYFIFQLINELTYMIPTEKERLSSNRHRQFDPADSMKILISLSISENKSSNQLTTADITNYLDQLIKNKAISIISMGHTTIYLDEIYGFGLSIFIMYFAAFVEFYVDLTLLMIVWMPNEDFVRWFLKNKRITTLIVLLSIIHVDILKMLKSRLGGLEHFNAPLPNNSSKIIFWGSYFSLFLTEVPQFVIQ
ncbi:14722_t:CDS:10, partial [Gigaspora margarita]